MSITISRSRYDTHLMSLSELGRLLNIPVSRLNRSIGSIIKPCGQIGNSWIVALTDEDMENLRKKLHPARPKSDI